MKKKLAAIMAGILLVSSLNIPVWAEPVSENEVVSQEVNTEKAFADMPTYTKDVSDRTDDVETVGMETVGTETVETQEDTIVNYETEEISEDSISANETAAEDESGVSGIENIANPRIVPDSSMEAGQKVTYDCIWLGSYPQAEVVADKSSYTAIKSDYLEDGDITENAALYSQLQSASYDSKNETTINGTRYKRMLKGDATRATSGSSDYYNWSDSTTYHYFKYEPIKWRVIEKGSDTAFLLADRGLDAQRYNETYTSITWKDCTIRNFLNTTFYDNAFNSSEKAMIRQDKVENDDNLYYGTDGREDTYDNVFLLSEKEVYKTNGSKSFSDSSAAMHGFVDDYDTYDEAKGARATTYSRAMGSSWNISNSEGNSDWWLRSPGSSSSLAAYVNYIGYVYCSGYYVNNNDYATRPALKINLSSLTSSMYAGTVCSDGTVNETAKPGEGGGSGDGVRCIKDIANPRIVSDSSMNAGQKVTYDCIWLGSYPQAEVVADKSSYTAIDADYLEEGDIIENAALYSQLQSASYNSNNETTINGTRYKRMLKGDATYASTSGSSAYYNWSDSTTYHYFKYEPIKWRVIEKGSDTAFLLADKGLDDQKYNETRTGITWKDCTIRNFLNTTFYDNAFNTSEKAMIRQDKVENTDNLYNGTDGGEDTYDKVFLLSEKEVYKTIGDKSFSDSSAAVHGFVDSYSTYDEARRACATTYSRAMGIYMNTSSSYKGNSHWWLRSPGEFSSDAAYVLNGGFVGYDGYYVNIVNYTVRPALKINLSSLTDSMYAGTVCSNGTVNEAAKPGEGGGSGDGVRCIKDIANPRIVSDSSMDAGQKVTYDCIWFGSYPQAEVVASKSGYTAIKLYKDGDIIENAALYSQLKSVSYNSNNETTINGTRYKRMKKSDATHVASGYSIYYDWSHSATYHYFKYEPIKWRVIEKGSDTAFLLADRGLDDQRYNETYTSVTWKDCTLRNFLNTTFYDNAFNSSEKAMIRQDKVENADNFVWGTDGGEDTYDKVFLLSEKEVYKTHVSETFSDSSAAMHGFVDDCRTNDEARRARATTYSRAMGSRWRTEGSSDWYLRSPGSSSSGTAIVESIGSVMNSVNNVDGSEYTARPALKINLSSLTDSMYAGTVCSNGTVHETAKPEEELESTTVAVSKITLNKSSVELEVGDTETLNVTVTPADATDKSVTYESANTSVATVSANGKITAVGEGSTTITVKSVSNPEVNAECTVTVTKKAGEPDPSDPIDPDAPVEPTKAIKMIGSTGYKVEYIPSVSYNGVSHIEKGGKISASKAGDVEITLYDPTGAVISPSRYKVSFKNNKDTYGIKNKQPYFTVKLKDKVDKDVKNAFKNATMEFDINPCDIGSLKLSTPVIKETKNGYKVSKLQFTNETGKVIKLKQANAKGKGDFTVSADNKGNLILEGIGNYTGKVKIIP